MAAGAWQQAPDPRQAKTQGTPKRQAAPEAKHTGMKERLHALPQAAGIAAMIVMLVLALFIGNFRALQNATPKAFLRQGDVKSIVEDRIDAAMNVASVADRLGLGEVQTVYNAAEALEEAKTAREKENTSEVQKVGANTPTFLRLHKTLLKTQRHSCIICSQGSKQ